MGQIIDGKAIAQTIREEVAVRVRRLHEEGTDVGLAAVLVGDDPASRIYIDMKGRASRAAGIRSEVVHLPEETTAQAVVGEIERLNDDPGIHGILVQRPLPPRLPEHQVLETVAPAKDVDGFHPYSMGRLLAGAPTFIPATPLGIQELLLRSGHPPEGRDVVIVGRSSLVGRPLAALLAQKAAGADATVTLCHSRTADLRAHTRRAEILVVAVGSPELVRGAMVKRGAVVIDVGINRVPDAAAKRGYRIVGDVAFEEVASVAQAITPVPGGVGPMTVAMLLRNTVDAAEGAAEGLYRAANSPGGVR